MCSSARCILLDSLSFSLFSFPFYEWSNAEFLTSRGLLAAGVRHLEGGGSVSRGREHYATRRLPPGIVSLHGILRPWKERYAENGEGRGQERGGCSSFDQALLDVSRDGLFIYLFVSCRFDGCKKGLRRLESYVGS